MATMFRFEAMEDARHEWWTEAVVCLAQRYDGGDWIEVCHGAVILQSGNIAS